MCTFVPSNVQIYIQSGYAWIFSIIHTVSLPIPFRQHEGKLYYRGKVLIDNTAEAEA